MAALTGRSTKDYKVGMKTFPFTIDSGVEVFDGALLDFDKSAGEVVLAGVEPGIDNIFCGVAQVTDQADDSITGDGALKVVVDISGVIIREAAVAGLNTQTECGNPVFADNDNDLSLTQKTTQNAVGFVLDGVDPTAGTADVQLFPFVVGMTEPLGALTATT